MIHFLQIQEKILGHSVLLSCLLALLAVPKKALGVNLEPSLELAAALVEEGCLARARSPMLESKF